MESRGQTPEEQPERGLALPAPWAMPQPQGPLAPVIPGFEGKAHMACVSWRPEGDHTSQLPLQPGQATPAIFCSSSQEFQTSGVADRALTHSARTQRERDCHPGVAPWPKASIPPSLTKGPNVPPTPGGDHASHAPAPWRG